MNLGLPELVFIFLLALVLVGPRKLPELGRQLGRYLAEFKRASNDFRRQIEVEMLSIEREERAKKQADGPQVLPPEEPWERLMKPISESVSRTRQELVSVLHADPEPLKSASQPPPPTEQLSASAQAADHH
jgi:TatA/E family protein of Tat protein translocase